MVIPPPRRSGGGRLVVGVVGVAAGVVAVGVAAGCAAEQALVHQWVPGSIQPPQRPPTSCWPCCCMGLPQQVTARLRVLGAARCPWGAAGARVRGGVAGPASRWGGSARSLRRRLSREGVHREMRLEGAARLGLGGVAVDAAEAAVTRGVCRAGLASRLVGTLLHRSLPGEIRRWPARQEGEISCRAVLVVASTTVATSCVERKKLRG